jgi:hypothetical protein
VRVLTLTASLAFAAAVSPAGGAPSGALPLFAGAAPASIGDAGLVDHAQFHHHHRRHHHHHGWGHHRRGWGTTIATSGGTIITSEAPR